MASAGARSTNGSDFSSEDTRLRAPSVQVSAPMKKITALAAIAAVATLPFMAPVLATAQEAEAAKAEAIIMPDPAPADMVDRVRSTVEFLADDLLEGREAGKRGYELAARYVASKFTALGLKPGGIGGSYFQYIPFRHATLKEGSLKASVSGKPLDAGMLSIFPSVLESQTRLDGPLVFVGHGIKDDVLGINDYAGLDVTDKIVVAMMGAPKGYDSEISAHLNSTKRDAAAMMGAKGIIYISPAGAPLPKTEEAKKQFEAAKKKPLPTFSATEWVKDGQSSAGVGGNIPLMFIKDHIAATLFDGAAMSLDQVRAAMKDGAAPKSMALTSSLNVEADYEWRNFYSPEVIAILPGSDPVLKNEYVAMTGHLDHIGMKDVPEGKDGINNGALDNASGSATLIEAARMFASSGKAPKRSVMFILHTAEEKGLLGASYFAANPTVPIDSIVGSVNLDMPLVLFPFIDVVAFGGKHSTIEPALVEAANSMGIKVSPDFMPEQSIFVRSDHYEMVKAGVPSIMLSPGTANGGKAKWDHFLSTDYHQPSDEIDQGIDWDALARFADLNYRIAKTMANGEVRTKWYEGNYFGDSFNPGGARAKKAD